MNERIFIVDDDPSMILAAKDILEGGGYVVNSWTDSVAALEEIRKSPPDALLLDVRMPGMDGLQMCQRIKNDPKTKQIPILFVSVESEEVDVVLGLEFGAEDYVCKPFRRRELLARVKTILRRSGNQPVAHKTERGLFSLDHASYGATYDGKPIDLSAKEFELLDFFLRHESRVVTPTTISESVWGVDHSMTSKTLKVHVSQLRKKLSGLAIEIIALKNVGYRFELK